MATAPTVPPADGPALPPAPSQDDPDNFDAEADASFLAQIPFQVEMQTLKAYVFGTAQEVYSNAQEAAANATATGGNTAIALAAANFKGTYASRTGAAAVPYSVSHLGGFWMLLSNLADVTTKVPGTDAEWQRIDRLSPLQLAPSLVQQAVSGGAYALTNTTAQAAATNLALYSNQADNAAWTKSGCTVSADFTQSPTGNVDADKLIESATNVVHFDSQSSAVAANVAYTYSREIKAQGRTNCVLVIDKDGTGVDGVRATFNLTTGAVSAVTNIGAGTGAAATATYLGNGFWLCKLSGTPGAAAGTSVRYSTYIDSFAAYAGDGVSGIAVAEAQFETGTSATSRIATTSATVARAASVIAPQRVVAPTSAADAWFVVAVQNGIETNVVDLNGATFYGQSGIVKLDNAYLAYKFQHVNGTWRFVQ